METTLKQVALSQLVQRSNYRQEYDQDFVNKIASDMATNGYKVEYPIVTYSEGDQFVVIDGNTRFTATKLASSYSIKDHKALIMVWIVVKDKPTDSEFILSQLAANELRRDPDDISKAIGYQQALDSGASLIQIASETGHKVDYIERRVKLLKLAADLQPLVAKGQLPISYAGAITVLDSNRQRIAVQAYNRSKTNNLESFVENVVNPLYEQQVKESQQGNFFGLYTEDQLTAQIDSFVEVLAPKKTAKDLENELVQIRLELEAERKAKAELLNTVRADYAKLLTAYRALQSQVSGPLFANIGV
jgi:ParB-like chromosome segregation protein Spo0J